MAVNKTKLVSRFPEVKRGSWDAARSAVKHALDVGEHEAERKLEAIDDTRGYNLPINIGQWMLGHQSGMIFYEPWWGRFFEYGTVRIPAASFMRPAHRKMRKAFLEDMHGDVEKFIRRRVGRV